MVIREWLASATSQIEKVGILTARLDCLVLLEDLLGKNRAQLLAHDQQQLTNEQILLLNRQIKRRANHEPLAYIRGKTEFYGREFLVSPDTLEPRPETETMIELAMSLKLPSKPHIADIGAGSGAIGITLALALPDAQVDMYEISSPAVRIAEQNLKRLKARNCRIYKSDLLNNITTPYDLIVANLPYVPDAHTINQAAMQEPKLAIFGGEDGLDVYRRFFLQIASLLQKNIDRPTFVLTEALPFQHKQLTMIAKQAGYKLTKTNDFIQQFSVQT